MDLMRSTQTMTEDQLHTLSDKYDSIYIHPVRTLTRKETVEQIKEPRLYFLSARLKRVSMFSGVLHSGCDGGGVRSPAGG